MRHTHIAEIAESAFRQLYASDAWPTASFPEDSPVFEIGKDAVGSTSASVKIHHGNNENRALHPVQQFVQWGQEAGLYSRWTEKSRMIMSLRDHRLLNSTGMVDIAGWPEA